MAGQSWTANDGCNTCYCSAHAGGALCTEMACATTKPLVDVRPVATCVYNKVTYVTGDKYMATDGCNTCVCGSNGMTSCTKVFCQRGKFRFRGNGVRRSITWYLLMFVQNDYFLWVWNNIARFTVKTTLFWKFATFSKRLKGIVHVAQRRILLV